MMQSLVNLPQKSIAAKTVKGRKLNLCEDNLVSEVVPDTCKVKYKNLAEIFENIKTLKCTDH